MKIKYTGKEEELFKILDNLPGKSNVTAVTVTKNSITFPTPQGARQVFVGDTVIIEGDIVRVKEG